MFSSRNFIFLALTSGSMSHFKKAFHSQCSFYSEMNAGFSSIICWKYYFFPHSMIFGILSKINCSLWWVYVWTLISAPLIYLASILQISYHLGYSRHCCSKSEFSKIPTALLFFFKNCFGDSRSFIFHVNIKSS